MKNILYISLILSILIGCKEYDPKVSTSNSSQTFSANQIAEQQGYTIFNEAVAHSGIADELNPADSVTMLIPNNQAFFALFDALGVSRITEIDAAVVADVLRYHVLPGALSSTDLTASNATLLSGKSVYLSKGEGLGFNGIASVIEADLYNADGIIHGISAVLEAPAADIMTILRASSNHTALVTELERTGLDAALSGTTEYTIMAPGNASITAAGIAGLSVAEATEALSFHVFPGRVHSVEFADGRLATILGTTAADNVQEVEVDGLEFNGTEVDSANYSADNGLVHYVADVVLQDDEQSDFIPTDFQALIDALGATVQAEYNNLDTAYSFMALDAGAPAPGSFANNDAIRAWLDAYTWDGSVDLSGLSSGTKITTGSAARETQVSFYVESLSSTDSIRINNEAVVDEAGGESSYNGYYNRIVTGYPTALPTDKVSKVVESQGYTLLAKAIEVTGKTSQVDAENTTFYAISNAVFTDTTGYTTVGDLDTLSVDDENDDDVIAELSALIDAHTVPGNVQSSFVILNDVPIQVDALGDDIVWASVGGMVVIVTDIQDQDNTTVSPVTVDDWAANGVVHELSQVLTEVDIK